MKRFFVLFCLVVLASSGCATTSSTMWVETRMQSPPNEFAPPEYEVTARIQFDRRPQ